MGKGGKEASLKGPTFLASAMETAGFYQRPLKDNEESVLEWREVPGDPRLSEVAQSGCFP